MANLISAFSEAFDEGSSSESESGSESGSEVEYDEFGEDEDQIHQNEQRSEMSETMMGIPVFNISSQSELSFLSRIPMGPSSSEQVQTSNPQTYSVPVPGSYPIPQQSVPVMPTKPKLNFISSPFSTPAPTPMMAPSGNYPPTFPMAPKPGPVNTGMGAPIMNYPQQFPMAPKPAPVFTGTGTPTGVPLNRMPPQIGVPFTPSMPVPQPAPLSVQVEPIQRIAQSIQQLQLTPEYSQATLDDLLIRLGESYPDFIEIKIISTKLNGLNLGLTPSACIALSEIIIKKYKYGAVYSPEMESTIKQVAPILEQAK